jgi:hypothetical protein
MEEKFCNIIHTTGNMKILNLISLLSEQICVDKSRFSKKNKYLFENGYLLPLLKLLLTLFQRASVANLSTSQQKAASNPAVWISL